MKFIWDKAKNEDNIKNHNISFEEAQTAFFDPNGRLISDPDHSVEIIRIISARKATKTEAKYYGG